MSKPCNVRVVSKPLSALALGLLSWAWVRFGVGVMGFTLGLPVYTDTVVVEYGSLVLK